MGAEGGNAPPERSLWDFFEDFLSLPSNRSFTDPNWMVSTIPDFLTRHLPWMEFIDTHYVLVGNTRLELVRLPPRHFKCLVSTYYTNSPYLTFCIYYTLKFPESQNSNVSCGKTPNPQMPSSWGFWMLARAYHTFLFVFTEVFSWGKENYKLPEVYFVLQRLHYKQALPSLSRRHALRPVICEPLLLLFWTWDQHKLFLIYDLWWVSSLGFERNTLKFLSQPYIYIIY